jgi:hypothetical protein
LQIWVLMGGDGTEREASMASGANAVSKLQRCSGLRVEPLLLAPLHSSTGEQRRRSELLRCGGALARKAHIDARCQTCSSGTL